MVFRVFKSFKFEEVFVNGNSLMNFEVYLVSVFSCRMMYKYRLFSIILWISTRLWDPHVWFRIFWANKIFIANGAIKFDPRSFWLEIYLQGYFEFLCLLSDKLTVLNWLRVTYNFDIYDFFYNYDFIKTLNFYFVSVWLKLKVCEFS